MRSMTILLKATTNTKPGVMQAVGLAAHTASDHEARQQASPALDTSGPTQWGAGVLTARLSVERSA